MEDKQIQNPMSRKLFVSTLLAGTFTMSISQSSLSTAYPTLMKFFGVTAPTIQWLTTGFMLIMSIMMPISPWLLNNISFKKLFLSVVGIFGIGTLVIIVSQSFAMAMLGRALEAIGVGILFPSFQSVLLAITPEENRGTTMGFAGLVMGSALASGPIISGIVLNYLKWQGLFVIFLIIMVLIFVLGSFYIKDVMPRHKMRLDFLSIVYLVGLIGLLYVVNQAGSTHSFGTSLLIILIISIVLTGLFIYRQLTSKEPLLDLKVMKTFNFDLAILLTGFSYISLIVVTIIYPLYYQNILHTSVLISGLALVPPAILLSILNPLTGKLADKIGFKPTLLSGMSMIVVGWFLLFVINIKLGIWPMILIAMLIEGGNAFVMMPATTLGGNSLPEDLIPHGTAIITTVRQLLGSLGVSLATLILVSSNQNHNLPANEGLAGYHSVFTFFFVLALIGLVFAIMVKDYKKSPKTQK
ncbi:MDR family MFS transporter [Companilactobacillus mishanensis]|uniref:Multidrug efflux MFS transporter n=1 Tax=Companilactobacillus mishanensis TaxID=2486008 RepID=A0A5P0ZFU7_9LACO|nr:MDR family MFS transporter [Companilactobacillus mishanensis]MQS45327.1 multidrug efflux MFS transporter [Companilactobacillus mishanensis]MQS51923.1 multidrug efflux MFS transporter [Companilactobacillus mishanensis]